MPTAWPTIFHEQLPQSRTGLDCSGHRCTRRTTISTQKGSPNLIPVGVRRIHVLLYLPGLAGAVMAIRIVASCPGITCLVRKYVGLLASRGPLIHTTLYSVVNVHIPV